MSSICVGHIRPSKKQLSKCGIGAIAGRGELQQIVYFGVQRPPLMMLYV